MMQLRKKKEPVYNAVKFTGTNVDEVLKLVGDEFSVCYLPEYQIRLTKRSGNFSTILREGYYLVVEGKSVKPFSIEKLLDKFEAIWECDQELLSEHMDVKNKYREI
jgi:hypothetical protein